MATNTYVALHTNTVTGSAVGNYTYSSIPATYTDLICVIAGNASSIDDVAIQLNGDTATNYSITSMYGNGSSVTSTRTSTQSSMTIGGLSSVQGTSIFQFMNYSNATTYKTVLSRADASDWVAYTKVGLWRSTAAINSIKFIHSGNFAVGTTFNIYGIKATAATLGTAKATGGTISYDISGRVYHTFTASGTFAPTQSLSAEVLRIAGGGSGGGAVAANEVGGGGGAGGLLYSASQSLTAQNYTVTIGGGASGVSGAVGNKGTDTSFTGLTTAEGGGRGGGSYTAGGNGGSGGGGGGNAGTTGGTATSGQGNNGGNGTVAGGGSVGGGGGGAGGAGSNGSGNTGGAGGASTDTYSDFAVATSTGVIGKYAGGGGGSLSNDGGTGGTSGGGGATAGNAAGAATANTGSGSGGGRQQSGTTGNGGSGIVIIRYQG
jgi:hypothetical protein